MANGCRNPSQLHRTLNGMVGGSKKEFLKRNKSGMESQILPTRKDEESSALLPATVAYLFVNQVRRPPGSCFCRFVIFIRKSLPS